MTAPRYKTTKWNGLDNFECLHCKFATLDRGLIAQHVRGRHPTAAESGGHEPHPLASIPFASDEAAELAISAGLVPEDFANHSPTGQTGYVLDDVRRVAASATKED